MLIINNGELSFVFRLAAEGTHTVSSTLLLLRAKPVPEKQDAICHCDELTLAGLLALFLCTLKCRLLIADKTDMPIIWATPSIIC